MSHYKVIFLDDTGPRKIDFFQENVTEVDSDEFLSLPYRLLRGYCYDDPALKQHCEIIRVPMMVPRPPVSGVGLSRHLESASALETAERVLSNNPDMIALSLYVWNADRALRVAELCRQMDPDVTIVAGGPNTFGLAESLLAGRSPLDVAADGEGEETFLRLLRHYSLGTGDLIEVPSIAFRDGENVHRSSRVEWIDNLDRIPSVTLPYALAEITRGGICHFEAARGCPNHCIYCQYSKRNNTIRSYSIDRILADLAHMRKLGVKRVSFIEPSFNLDARRASTILEYFIEEYVDCRVILEINLDQTPQALMVPLRQLVDAGRVFCVVGVQSTSQNTLRLVGRRSNLHKLKKNAQELFQKPLSGETNIMVGLPGDSFRDLLGTLDYCNEMLPGLQPTLLPVMVLPGTAMRDSATSLGLAYDPSPPYHVLKTRTLPAEDMRKALILCRMTPRLIRPLFVFAKSLGVRLPTLCQEVFDATCFSYLETFGSLNPTADLFFLGQRLRPYVLARAGNAAQREQISEYIDFLTLLSPEYDANTAEAFLELPSRLRSKDLSVGPVPELTGESELALYRKLVGAPAFYFRHFRSLVTECEISLETGVEFHSLRGEECESACCFLPGSQKIFLSPNACRSLSLFQVADCDLRALGMPEKRWNA